MALIQDIADCMSPAQISQIHGISTEQIPIFSLIWKEQINFVREEGIRENRPMELMFDVAELRAEMLKNWPKDLPMTTIWTTTIRNR
jgi:hypothetical protein